MIVRRFLQSLLKWWNLIRVAKNTGKIPRLSASKLPSQVEGSESVAEDT